MNAAPVLSTIGLARAIALFDGIRLVASHHKFNDDKQLDAEALAKFVESKASDKIALHLLKQGETLIPELIAEDACEHVSEEIPDVDEIEKAWEEGPSEKELALMAADDSTEED